MEVTTEFKAKALCATFVNDEVLEQNFVKCIDKINNHKDNLWL